MIYIQEIYVLTPQENKIGVFDFGLVSTFCPKVKSRLLCYYIHLFNQKWGQAVSEFVSLFCILTKPLSINQINHFYLDMYLLFQLVETQQNIQQWIFLLVDLLQKYNIHTTPEFSNLELALVNVEGSVMKMNHQTTILSLVRQALQDVIGLEETKQQEKNDFEKGRLAVQKQIQTNNNNNNNKRGQSAE